MSAVLQAADGRVNTPESEWLAWDGMERIQTMDLEELLPPDARLVVVAPHPDDEVMICGGLMWAHTNPHASVHANAETKAEAKAHAKAHSKRHGDVLIISVTDGEATHPGSANWNSEALAEARRRESNEAIATLATSKAEVRRLTLPDGEIADHVGELDAALLESLLPGDVVFTTWRRDGNPDHEACGNAVARVCATIGCRVVESPVSMWCWAKPGDKRVAWSRMRGWAIPPGALSKKRMALASHVTQLVPRDTGEGPVLDDEILARLDRPNEYFIVSG